MAAGGLSKSAVLASVSEDVDDDDEDGTDHDELRRQLKEVQRQANEYKLQLQRKEREAEGYKKQLSKISKLS